MKDEPPLKKVICVVAILIFLPLSVYAPWDKYVEPNPVIIQENSLIAISSSKPRATDDLFEDLAYRNLIKCLAFRESSFNPNAVGDKGTSFGLLQFKKTTWNMYCEGDIWNPEHQVNCCDEMLKDNFGNIRHWTTRKYCLN